VPKAPGLEGPWAHIGGKTNPNSSASGMQPGLYGKQKRSFAIFDAVLQASVLLVR
jgi:hypothetical protein